jgi:RNA polymerase sigma-70 factor (ECF subfamily)
MTRDNGIGIRYFPTTHWSLVQRAGRPSDAAQRDALGELVERYLPALRSHLVIHKRIEPHRAEDLVQEFLLSKVIERELIGQADRQRGKFRSFLLVSLDRFVISEFRREQAQKRSAPGTVPIDENLDVADNRAAPTRTFDIAWARQLLTSAIQVMKKECHANARPDVWGVFQGRILDPVLNQTEPVSYDSLVKEYDLPSPAAASNLLVTAQRMFVRVLREQIGQYEEDESQIDEEIADLQRILAS